MLNRVVAGEVSYNKMWVRKRAFAVLGATEDGLFATGEYPTFELDPTLIEAGYLFYVMQSDDFCDEAAARCKGTTSRARLHPRDFLRLTIAVPPLSDQRAMAAVLQGVDMAIEASRAVVEQTRRVKAGLLQELLTRGIGPDGRLQAGYVRTSIARAGDVQLGQQRHPKYATGDNLRPYLRVANVLDGRIDFTDLNEMHFPREDLPKFELRPGDILLNEGQSLDLVGRSALYRGEIPGCCVQKTLIRYRCGPALLPEYALALFQHWLLSGVFAEVAVQTTSVAHLTAVRFKRMPLILPRLSDQKAIANKVQAIDEQHRLSVEAVDQLSTLKSGLLQDLLSGAVRVKP